MEEGKKEHLRALYQFNQYFLSCQLRLFITLLSEVCNTEPIRDCALLLAVNEGLRGVFAKADLRTSLQRFPTVLLLLMKSLRAHLSLWGVCNAAFIHTWEQSKRTAAAGGAPLAPGTVPPLPSSSLICRGKLFTWSSLHPLSPLTSQCCSLSAVISGSFRTASLSFTLGSISMSLEGISKARGPLYHPSMVLMSWAYLDPESSWPHAATE